MARLAVVKTYKLFINGAFPRSESGRSLPVHDGRGEVIALVSHGSRKDLRDAVEAAMAAQPKWANATAYNRGQVLYRMAEMLEGKRAEFIEAMGDMAKRPNVQTSKHLRDSSRRRNVRTINGKSKSPHRHLAMSPNIEVDAAIDRLVSFAGWADKLAQVLGCANAVAGPYYNFTIPEPVGVVGVVGNFETSKRPNVERKIQTSKRPNVQRAVQTFKSPVVGRKGSAAELVKEAPALLGLVTLLAPAVCAGNAVVAIADGAAMIPAAIFGEVCATSDVPPGVVNIITGRREELLEHLAGHGDVNAIVAANLPREQRTIIKLGVAENLKRVHALEMARHEWFDAEVCEGPAVLEHFVEMKTIWHPSAM